jgi:hypothetical protein
METVTETGHMYIELHFNRGKMVVRPFIRGKET